MTQTPEAAIRAAWQAILKGHVRPVPKLTVLLSPTGAGSSCGSVTWDAEIVLRLAPEELQLPPLDLFGWLAHMAVHAMVAARGIPQATMDGRYHGAEYRDAAAQLGLEVYDAHGTGWSLTTVPDPMATQYAGTIESLGDALKGWELPVPASRARRTAADMRNGVAAYCQCQPPRRIRVAESVLDRGEIMCEICCQPFEPAAAKGRFSATAS
jgi:hypothetical protein